MICPNCQFNIKTRTVAQNRSLHLFFEWIADMFNETGETYTNPMGIETIWTAIMVKEIIWKPLQFQLCGTKSTTELTNKPINHRII